MLQAARLLVNRVALAVGALILPALDRMLGTQPRDVTWVPEARPSEGERWEA